MTEAEWLAATEPTPMVEFLRGKTSDRKLRLFTCACFQVQFPFSRDDFGCELALIAAEKMADGQLTDALRDEAIAATEQSGRGATNAWSYLVTAAASLMHPIGIESANLTIENLDTFDSELDFSNHDTYVAALRDIFGNPFRPVTLNPSWLTSTVLDLANGIYDEKAFDRMPILADALQDAGCDNEDILNHCRGPGAHVRGCFVLDLLTGRS